MFIRKFGNSEIRNSTGDAMNVEEDLSTNNLEMSKNESSEINSEAHEHAIAKC